MALDGHLHTRLEGKTIEAVEKTGTSMIIHLTSGERVRIGWYDGSKKLPGEPQYEGQDVILSLNKLIV